MASDPGKLPNEIDIVRDVSERLDRAGIPFMLTGSLAMNYYAEPRMTRDIDIVVEIQPEEGGRMVDLFSRSCCGRVNRCQKFSSATSATWRL